jgi:hypothetical protein
MSLRSRIQKIDEALSFYKSLPTGTDEAHIHYAWCLSKLVANLNDSLKSYLDDLEKGQCKEVLGIDYQKMTCKDYWLRGGSLKKRLSIPGQTLLNDFLNDVTFKKILTVDDIFNKLEEVVNELVDLLKEAKKKTMNAPKGLFSNFYSQQSEQNSEPVATAYEEWKMNVGCLTFERLKEKQMLTVADFLKNGILRCAPPPTQREICLVKLDLVKEYLPCDYQLPDDFVSQCAVFRRFISWQGDVLKINYEVYGKYMFLYSHQLSDDEILELYRFDRTLMMIHEDIERLRKEEGLIEEVMEERKEGNEGIKNGTIGRKKLSLQKLACAIENCQKYFWGNSSYGVVFCLCRDDYEVEPNKSAFEHMAENLPYTKKLSYLCKENTLATAFSNNPIFNENINNWDSKNPMKRIIKLRDELRKPMNS